MSISAGACWTDQVSASCTPGFALRYADDCADEDGTAVQTYGYADTPSIDIHALPFTGSPRQQQKEAIVSRTLRRLHQHLLHDQSLRTSCRQRHREAGVQAPLRG